MAALAFAAPILPGKLEAWRRFIQELQGSRLVEYAESRRRLGITEEWVWWVRATSDGVALLCLEGSEVGRIWGELAGSEWPFDRWFRQQLHQLCGIDVAHEPGEYGCETVFQWSRVSR